MQVVHLGRKRTGLEEFSSMASMLMQAVQAAKQMRREQVVRSKIMDLISGKPDGQRGLFEIDQKRKPGLGGMLDVFDPRSMAGSRPTGLENMLLQGLVGRMMPMQERFGVSPGSYRYLTPQERKKAARVGGGLEPRRRAEQDPLVTASRIRLLRDSIKDSLTGEVKPEYKNIDKFLEKIQTGEFKKLGYKPVITKKQIPTAKKQITKPTKPGTLGRGWQAWEDTVGRPVGNWLAEFLGLEEHPEIPAEPSAQAVTPQAAPTPEFAPYWPDLPDGIKKQITEALSVGVDVNEIIKALRKEGHIK